MRALSALLGVCTLAKEMVGAVGAGLIRDRLRDLDFGYKFCGAWADGMGGVTDPRTDRATRGTCSAGWPSS